MKHLFIYILFITGGVIFLQSCDSTTSPENPLADKPSISSFSINPSQVQFNREQDGFKDTTLTVTISASLSNAERISAPRYAVFNKSNGEFVAEGELNASETDASNFSASAEINTSTTSNQEFTVNLILNSTDNIYAQTTFSVKGFANFAPEIIFAENPEEVQIPNDDSVIPVRFEAKVTDADGQDNISGVYIEFLNADGSKLVPNPNELLDDGMSGNANDSGDQFAGDSVYTIRFFIDSSNTPNMRTAQYYALDATGLSSDTVETTFNIVE